MASGSFMKSDGAALLDGVGRVPAGWPPFSSAWCVRLLNRPALRRLHVDVFLVAVVRRSCSGRRRARSSACRPCRWRRPRWRSSRFGAGAVPLPNPADARGVRAIVHLPGLRPASRGPRLPSRLAVERRTCPPSAVEVGVVVAVVRARRWSSRISRDELLDLDVVHRRQRHRLRGLTAAAARGLPPRRGQEQRMRDM